MLAWRGGEWGAGDRPSLERRPEEGPAWGAGSAEKPRPSRFAKEKIDKLTAELDTLKARQMCCTCKVTNNFRN